MTRPNFYFLLLLCAYGCIFLFPSYWLFLPALYVFIYLSHTLRKSLFWLGIFNLLMLFWLSFLILGGEWKKGFKILWVSNLFITFALGLYCHRGTMFITQSLQNFSPKKMNILVFLSAKLIDELKHELKISKHTFQIRLPSHSNLIITCKAYGYLIGKLICHGLLRAEQLSVTLKVRGYDGSRLGILSEFATIKDYFALGLLLISILLGELYG